MSEPNWQALSTEQSKSEGLKYFRAWKSRGQKLDLYSQVINALTERPAEEFIQQADGKTIIINEENIVRFKQSGDGISFIRKAKQEAEISRAKITELEEQITHLQRELSRQNTTSFEIISALSTELKRFKESDPVERRRTTFGQLFARRQRIPIENIKSTSDKQADLLSQIFSTEFPSSETDDRTRIMVEQKEVELNIIEECLELLRENFDELPKGATRVDKSTISVDIDPILEILLEARSRFSYVVSEKVYSVFLKEHMAEMTEILDLFASKSKDSTSSDSELCLRLSPYEKRLLRFIPKQYSESYLACYERNLDIQRRILLSSKMSLKLNSFGPLEEFPSSFVFAQPEDVVKNVLLTSSPINNVAYIRLSPDPKQSSSSNASSTADLWSFYLLQNVREGRRQWKLDVRAIHTARLFKHQYLLTAERIFKDFYRDVFGNNNYKPDFESEMEAKGIERWKQMSTLYENIQVVADEYLLGEIIRKVIRTQASHYPREGIDVIQGDKDLPDMQLDFRRIRERWKQGLPPCEEEPEEWLSRAFDKYKLWTPQLTAFRYRKRWADYIGQQGKAQ